ncbi:wax synthase family protein [Cohnella soli]|uniref:Wax synthase family protein n=1 Tax=Cohnella soli TaxID=425005 RepID=A0ABW0HW62_9BACL
MIPALIALICACIPVLGYRIALLQSMVIKRSLAWGMAAFALMLADRIVFAQPAVTRMIVIIVVLLYAMKSVTYVECSSRTQGRLPVLRWVAFHFWIGMKPYVFAKRKAEPYRDAPKYMKMGIARLLLGLLLIILSSYSSIGTTALLLTGISFAGHFGLLNIWAGAWRWAGFDCQQLFRNPVMAKSLNEFWSKRWNLAFSEMTTLSVYRPLLGIIGKNGAAFISFLFSGIMHELAISLPVRQSFGMPLLYFVIHGIGIVAERVLEGKGFFIASIPWLGRVWTFVWLVLPLPLLFNPSFLKAIMWPI